MTPSQARRILEGLIGEGAFPDFFEQGHEDHLHSPAGPLTRESRALLGDDPDRALHEAENRLRRHGEFRSLSTDGDVDLTDRYHGSGSLFSRECETHNRTITFKAVAEIFPRIHAVKRALQLTFSAPVDVNLYYSPGSAQGSGLHYDSKDIFAVHLRGRKTWKVERAARTFIHPFWELAGERSQQPPDPSRLETRDVGPGDLLYIPAGHWHEAAASPEGSIHVSIGFRPITVRDGIIAILDHLATRDEGFRSYAFGLTDPVSGLWGEGRSSQAWGDAADRLNGQLASLRDQAIPVDPDFLRLILTERRARFIQSLPFMPGGDPEEAIQLIDGGTLMGLREFMIGEVTADANGATLRYPGGLLSGPRQIEAAFRHILDHPCFTADGLPGELGTKAKIMLVQKLARRGVVERIDETALPGLDRSGEGAEAGDQVRRLEPMPLE
jgi:ribosomal protein L16 Arg81 hydroxylase